MHSSFLVASGENHNFYMSIKLLKRRKESSVTDYSEKKKKRKKSTFLGTMMRAS